MLLYITIKFFCIIFLYSFSHIQYLDFHRSGAKLNLYNVSGFYSQRCLGRLAANQNTSRITGLVGNCSALYQPRHL